MKFSQSEVTIDGETFSDGEEAFMELKDRQSISYGEACFEQAKILAETVESEIEEDALIVEAFDQASNFMESSPLFSTMGPSVITILHNCWQHGEQFSEWYRDEFVDEEVEQSYNQSEDTQDAHQQTGEQNQDNSTDDSSLFSFED